MTDDDIITHKAERKPGNKGADTDYKGVYNAVYNKEIAEPGVVGQDLARLDVHKE